MVSAIKLTGTFYGNYVSYIFNYTNDLLVTRTISAYRTNITVTNIIAALTKLNFIAHFFYGITKHGNIFGVLL